jgi:hypothetical protein
MLSSLCNGCCWLVSVVVNDGCYARVVELWVVKSTSL